MCKEKTNRFLLSADLNKWLFLGNGVTNSLVKLSTQQTVATHL